VKLSYLGERDADGAKEGRIASVGIDGLLISTVCVVDILAIRIRARAAARVPTRCEHALHLDTQKTSLSRLAQQLAGTYGHRSIDIM
jgi:hypothetical protein